MSKRIVIATIGSLGDLHPCLALAMELMHRGHFVTIASTEFYRNKVGGLGIGFSPMRPDWDPTDRELIQQCEDVKRGAEVLYRKLILRCRYSASAAVAALQELIGQTRFRTRAAEISARVRGDDGLTGACNAIESVI